MTAIDIMRDTLNHPARLVEKWKAEGKKIVAHRCTYVPEEMILAAGMIPYPTFGTPEAITKADSYFQSCVCEYIRNIFDQALDNKWSFVDAIVVANTCDTVRKLHDHWNTYIQGSPCYIINNPQMLQNPNNRNFYLHELQRFKKWLEDLSGNEITDEALQKAIYLYNENRALLRELYSLRKSNPPLISGTEALEISMASTLMTKEEANDILRQVIDEVKARNGGGVEGPRILLTGGIIDNPELVHMVEECGAAVVADDLCTSARTFWYDVKDNGNPLEAIYAYNNDRVVCACMHPFEARYDYLYDMAKEYEVDGVIYFNMMHCHPFLFECPLYRDKLQAAGIPTIMLETGHDLSGIGQLRTRVQAFIEMLG